MAKKAVEQFITSIPAGDDRALLVFRREYRGRAYVRMRFWNRHRELRVWYPNRGRTRALVLPIELATALAEALEDAVSGRSSPPQDWHVRFESGLETDLDDWL